MSTYMAMAVLNNLINIMISPAIVIALLGLICVLSILLAIKTEDDNGTLRIGC